MPRTASTVPAVLLAAFGLAGCGAAQDTSADRFSGEEKRVAQVVDDLQAAAEKGDAAEICSRLLARAFVDRLAAGGSNCTAELDKALDDADNDELTVRGVEVDGTAATAVVRDAEGAVRSIDFAREGSGWRATSLRGAG
jgi:hypothetical protein